jgi:hypothetical protein
MSLQREWHGRIIEESGRQVILPSNRIDDRFAGHQQLGSTAGSDGLEDFFNRLFMRQEGVWPTFVDAIAELVQLSTPRSAPLGFRLPR